MELFDSYSLFPDSLLYHLDPLPIPIFRPKSYFHEELVSFDLFDAFTDLHPPSYRKTTITRRLGFGSDLLTLCDRVSALESKFDRLVSSRRLAASDRKYTWTAEVKGIDADRKYKLIADIKEPKHHSRRHHHHHHLKEGNKTYKWIAEVKGKGEDGPLTRTYAWKASNRDADESSESDSDKEEKKKKKKKKKKKHQHDKKKKCNTRLVEIEDSTDHGIVALRQAFARRAGAIRAAKGKNKHLSHQDAALLIQMTFKAYLLRRSRALRALRELAVAKAKLKEIRALFNNFSYRRRVARDAEERQRFSERIIVLLLTVDAIEGVDVMVRSSKKSMVDELEAMLEVVDPHPPGKSLSMRRRTFDVPDGVIQKEIAEGVSHIVRMLEEEEDQASSEI